MTRRLIRVLVPLAGLACFSVLLTPAVGPADAECTGGICDVCPVVAGVLTAAGAETACLA